MMKMMMIKSRRRMRFAFPKLYRHFLLQFNYLRFTSTPSLSALVFLLPDTLHARCIVRSCVSFFLHFLVVLNSVSSTSVPACASQLQLQLQLRPDRKAKVQGGKKNLSPKKRQNPSGQPQDFSDRPSNPLASLISPPSVVNHNILQKFVSNR